MELLNQLEKRMDDLLAKINVLQEVNSRLEQEHLEAMEIIDKLEAEKTSLKEALSFEQQKNASAQERVESILHRLKEQMEI